MADNILINFPTNIGDTILGLPVLDRLRASYPLAYITAIASSRTKDFLPRNNFIDKVIFFDKFWKIRDKIGFSFSLRNKYDLVVDLKNSFLPVIIKSKLRTPFYRKFTADMHAKDRYLRLISNIALAKGAAPGDFILTEEEKQAWDNLNISSSVFIATASRSSSKSYPYDCLKTVIDALGKNHKLVILGEEADRRYYKDVLFKEGIVDLVGKTKFYDIFYLLKNYAKLLLCVDSSILQISSYLNVPIVALFGPTDSQVYGPWSERSIIIKDETKECAPCKRATCEFNYGCMKIEPQKVLDKIYELING